MEGPAGGQGGRAAGSSDRVRLVPGDGNGFAASFVPDGPEPPAVGLGEVSMEGAKALSVASVFSRI